MILKEKFIGSLIGEGVGDSLGAKFEGFSSFCELRELGERYTDDTHMMIGIAESLVRVGGSDSEDMVQTFVTNYEQG